MKQRLSMLWVFLLSFVVGAWADTEVSPVGGSSNATVNGTSFSINGTTNAGSGTKISPMSDKGIKVRVSTPLVMTVNAGYRINSVTAYAASNDNSKTFTIEKIEVDGTEYVPSGVTMPITCVQKNATEATAIDITGIAATKDIKFTFGGTGSQGIMEFHVDYTQTEVILQEITSVTLNNSAISDADLETLKTTKALTIDGSSLNGIGILDVTLSSGATTVNRAFDGDNVVYTFTTNGGADKYTVTVTGVAKTYAAAQGTVVYYKEDALSNEKKTLTIDGVAFNYPSKQFGYANNTAGVTLGETTYKPIKLSTGEAVSVTFPEGKKVKKIIVYGWSAGGLGTGKLVNFTDGGEKSVDTSNDIFYANDASGSIYPTVYEYEVDNWEAFTFQGNGDQPFVVMDFVFASETPATKYTIGKTILPEGAATFNLTVTEAAAGEEVTATIDPTSVTFAEGWGWNNINEHSLVSLKTESGVDVPFTTNDATRSATFTMPAENVIATFQLFQEYQVSLQQAVNGTYKVDGHEAGAGMKRYEGEVSEFTEIVPDFGYKLGTITVTAEDGTDVPVADYKFTMPAQKVTVTVTFEADLGATATFDFTANEWNNPTATSSLDAASAPIGTLEKDGIKAVFKRATGNQPYYFANSTTAQARLLKNNILKVIAPEGKAILKVVFTAPTYNLSGDGLTEKTWTGNATRVAFNATGSCYFTQMDVTYADMTSETVDPEEADETITLDFNDPTAHSEFNVTENTYLTQDIVLSDGPAEQGSRVKTTIPFIEGATTANQNYIRVSGLNVSMYLRGGKVVFEADGDKVIKNIKMTSAAFNATLNGETVTKDQITGDGWNGNSSRVEMEVTGGTNITDITFTLGDKPVPVAVKYPIEAIVTPAEALTFDYNPKEAAAGEEVTVALSNLVFGEGYSSTDLLTATTSLKTESGTDVEYTLEAATLSIKFTMPEEKVIASLEFAPKTKDIVYDFAAAAAAGENPSNVNGGSANGAIFYGWENEGKTYSKRQDYKGYAWAEGSVLPEECHVWRRSDRINGNMTAADAEVLGLNCPAQREMAINGLSAGQQVVIEYTGEGEILYATGFDAANPTAEPNTVAVVGDGNKAAVSGTTTIASGTPIHIVSTDNGYFVFRVLKNMVIQKITISEESAPIDPASVVKPNIVSVSTEIANGTAKADKVQAFEGDEVTVTATPAEGYELDAITVTGVNTNVAVEVTDGKFTMPADDVTISVTFKEATLTAISGINADAAADDNDAPAYNLAGQKVGKNYKGIVIKNGKKVVMK